MLHLIYLRSGALLLSRKPYTDWREVQDDWDDYMTSLGPWTTDEVLGFLSQQYGEDPRRWPFTPAEVERFAASDRETMTAEEG